MTIFVKMDYTKVAFFSFSNGVSVSRIKKYTDRGFSETFGSVT